MRLLCALLSSPSAASAQAATTRCSPERSRTRRSASPTTTGEAGDPALGSLGSTVTWGLNDAVLRSRDLAEPACALAYRAAKAAPEHPQDATWPSVAATGCRCSRLHARPGAAEATDLIPADQAIGWPLDDLSASVASPPLAAASSRCLGTPPAGEGSVKEDPVDTAAIGLTATG